MTLWIRLILTSIWISLVCSACSATHPPRTPADAPTMADIYHRTQRSTDPGGAWARTQIHDPFMAQGARTLHAHSDSATFALLPNPLVTVYVYPHLATAEQLPIPGYQTQFPLYETPTFAKPQAVLPPLGEV